MFRTFLGSVAVLAIFAVGLTKADDSKNKSDKDKQKGTITNVDSKTSSITVSMKDQDGKKAEKTFQLAQNVAYLDSSGKTAKIDAFHSGDRVLITQKDGKVTELKKGMAHAQATITKVDAKNGTVTVKMKDQNGKDVEKTFYLTEEAEYLDSTGEVATIEIFESGDYVLLVETDGKVKELKKESKPDDKKSAAK